MPFISEPLDDIHEPKAAPEDEYDLRIVKADQRDSKAGNDMIALTLVFDDPSVDAPPFNHFLINPEGADEDKKRMWSLEIKRFCAAFDVAEDFEAEDLVGEVGRGIFVTQEEGDDGVIRNRMRLPRLKE